MAPSALWRMALALRVEHVLATQTLIQKKAPNMLVRVDGKLAPGATQGIILAIIGEIGTAGTACDRICGRGDFHLSVEGRMPCATCRSRRRAAHGRAGRKDLRLLKTVQARRR